MRVSRMSAVVIVGLTISFAGGCATDTRQQAELLTQENIELRRQLANRSDDLAEARQLLRQREIELAGQKATAKAIGPKAIQDILKRTKSKDEE